MIAGLRRSEGETRRSLELTHRTSFASTISSRTKLRLHLHGICRRRHALAFARGKKPKVFEPGELQLAAQLCDALEYAHNRAKIIHRDFKPSNLMVNQRGESEGRGFRDRAQSERLGEQ